MRIHYLQHVSFENPGSILVWARKNAHAVTSTHLYKNDTLPSQDEFDWLVIMGGPMNIYEEDAYLWFADEKAFIKEAILQGKVVIGLCLGGQLIADVIGGKVTKNEHKEIGWFSVKLTNSALSSELFSFFPQEPTVFQWHGDTFSVLPKEAEVIATSEACANQAFVYKKRVFGFQYHLECTLGIIQALIENCGDEMIADTYVQMADEVLAHIELMKQDNEWMDAFLTRLEKLYKKGEV